MIDDVKRWIRARAGKVLVCSTGALLALSLALLGTSLLGDGTADAEAQADELIVSLEEDLQTAQTELRTQHETLLSQLPGMDVERVSRDRATARSVLLSLTASSSSSRGVAQTQAHIDARYEFLSPDSRALTEFIPEWMAATGSGQGAGTTYRLALLDIDVSGVQGLDYSYVGVARLDPVSVDGETTGKSEYVIFTYATGQDGSVASFEAYRASSRSRDALVAAEQTTAEGETIPEDDAEPTTVPSDGG